jgi:phage N-6-adenine-methyltransferase
MKPKAIDPSTLEPHAFAELLPMMADSERAEVRASLLTRGYDVTEPIVLYKGQILDGRNRFELVQVLNDCTDEGEPIIIGREITIKGKRWKVRARSGTDITCELVDASPGGPPAGYTCVHKHADLRRSTPLVPTFTTFEGSDDEALALVLSKNVARRHLTPSQRAMVAATLVTSRRGRPGRKGPDASPMISQYAAASKLGVSERSVREAIKLLRANPELASGVASGDATLHEASSKAKPKDDTDEWYTDPETCARVRAALDGIELDPASCATAQRNVKASRFYTKKQNGLAQSWRARSVFLQPPYSNPAPWVAKLLAALRSGAITDAVVLVNNDTDTDWCQALLQAAKAVVFPRGRFSFLRPDGTRGAGNRQGQIVFHLGRNPKRFLAAFATLRGSHGLLAGRAGVR